MKKLGIAFGGGGGRGAYQIGVWKALKEIGLDKQAAIVAGTSVGALNGAFFLQCDLKKIEDIWISGLNDKILIPSTVTEETLKGLSFERLSDFIQGLSVQGVFSQEGLLQIIDEILNLEAVSQSTLPFIVVCVDAKKNKTEYIRLNNKPAEYIKKALCASSAIPFVFPPVHLEGKTYVDGGIPLIGDNLPIKPLYKEGCDTIIAVHLDRTTPINKNDYPYSRIINVIPRDASWGITGVINGLLDFSPLSVRRRIDTGYEDAMRIFWENHLTDTIKFSLKKRPRELSSRDNSEVSL